MSVAGPTGAPVAEETEGVGALPGSFCSGVFYGGESDADALIVSDLPLQGGSRFASEQVSEAIAYVLRRHGFRAGSHRVAYQSCDDSTSQTGIFDEAKCEANAKAYAANADVVGVVGPYNSGCAFAQLPILNRARGGPVATVGFSTSVIDLTRLGPTGPRDGLQRLYPTGTRNYVRVFSADDFDAAAHALLARSLGLQRVFVLHDGDATFGLPRAISFVTAARRLGLRIGGPRAWDPEERGYRRVVDAVARFRPDGVFLGGGIYSNGGAVIRELRSRVPAVRVLAPEFLPVSDLFRAAGPAARGTYVSLIGLTLDRLPPAGRRFVREFGATQAGGRVDVSTVYAAQATEVLLAAIARSDGTRAAVTRELFTTRIANGLVGDIRFTRAGDPVENPTTILRVARPGGASVIQGYEGATIERVIRPPPQLVS